MKMSWNRTSMPGGLMPTLQVNKADETDLTAHGSPIDAIDSAGGEFA